MNDKSRPKAALAESAVAADNTESVPLTDDEEGRLNRLESVVEQGLDTFVAVGTALAEINTSRLYRQTHDSFDAYLRDRYDGRLSRSRAYQLMDAAGVSTMVDTLGAPVPTSERQARELVGLPAAVAAEVMTAVTNSGQKVTAEVIADEVAFRAKIAASDVVGDCEEAADIEAMAAVTDSQFEEVLADSRRQGDLSRRDVADRARDKIKARRRTPLPDRAWKISRDLTKVTDSLARIHADDRWESNRPLIAARHRPEMYRALETLLAVLRELDIEVNGSSLLRVGWTPEASDGEIQ